MWDAALPLTTDNLVDALEVGQPEYLAAVPYTLQLLADSPRGIAAMLKCKLVSYGGAACPDELGDRLVAEGIKLSGFLGA